MPVTELLVRNAREHGDEVALVELNPSMEDPRKLSFKEFDLVQQTVAHPYRRQITWQVFDEKAKDFDLLIVPGSGFGCPGHTRISYCVPTQRAERSLEAFAKLAAFYR